MKLELKHISLWSTVKMSFVLNLVLGFIVGCFYSLILAAVLALPSAAFRDAEADGLRNLGGVFLLFFPFLMAFGAAIFNTIFAFIMVVVYNFMGRTVGGLELEFAHIDERAAPAAPAVVYQQPVPPAPPAPSAPVASPYGPKPSEPPPDFQL
jgi:hypothetical protein